MDNNQNQNQTPSLANLAGKTNTLLGRNRIVLAPIAKGEHIARLIDLEEKTSKTNGRVYVNATMNVDGEPANRTRSLFEVEFGLFCAGVGAQLELLGKTEAEILTEAKTKTFKIWLVEQDNPENPDKPYVNWLYTEPRQSASTAAEPNQEVVI